MGISDFLAQLQQDEPTAYDKLGTWIAAQAKSLAPMLFPSEWERYAQMDPLQRQGALGQSALDLLQPTMFVGPKAKGFSDMVQFSNMADRMPRAEISDEGMKLKLVKEGIIPEEKLSKVIEHKKLFEAYPWLKDTNVNLSPYMGESGNFNEALNLISTGRTSSIGKGGKIEGYYTSPSTLLHEIQHAIQEKEGWARGGSPDEFSKLRNWVSGKTQDLLEDINFIKTHPEEYGSEFAQALTQKQSELNQMQSIVNAPNPHTFYNRLAGEIEARDTASRMGLTPQERLSKMPYESQGIPLEDWIVSMTK